jgi:hypothetical protein
LVLALQSLGQPLPDGVLLTTVLTPLSPQYADRVGARAGLVEPPLDRGDGETHRLAGNRMLPDHPGQSGELGLELAGGRWRGQQRPHHGEAQVSPALV